jgi:5-methylcytosine-specific restriction endonuclease McrA
MRAYTLRHLGNAELLDGLRALVVRERESMATLLAHLGEVEARRLFLPAGYSSMFDYCTGEFGWSRQATLRRIGAARVARRFPRTFDALAEGRLHMSALLVVRPYLKLGDPIELLAWAENRSKAEVERMLAERFPRQDVPTRVEAIQPPATQSRLDAPTSQDSLESPDQTGTAEPFSDTVAAKIAPLAPERFALQVTIDGETREMLQRAQELLSHQLPSGEIALVLKKALASLIQRLESRKFGCSDRPRAPRNQSPRGRHIPAHVRRAVRERDGGCCTFIGEDGHRCATRRRLEFDHVIPVARGGAATVENLRLRCHAHNQHEADRVFGAEFMARKRRSTPIESQTPGAMTVSRPEPSESHPHDEEVRRCLRELGFRAEQVRRGVELGATLGEVSLEERVRHVLRSLGPKARTLAPGAAA